MGSLTFSSIITNSIRVIAETTKRERIKLEVQPFSVAFINAKVNQNIAIEIVIMPPKSILLLAVGS